MDTKKIRTGLSWLGVLGIGVTSWLSVICSRKADLETDPKRKALAYAPAVLAGVATSACVLGVNGLADKEIAALAAGCAYMARNRDKLTASKKLPGTKSEPEVVKKPDSIAPWEGPSVEWTGKGTLLCFEGYSGRLFYSSKEAVEKAEDDFNELYEVSNYACLNDFYKLLGISETHFGNQWGWARDSGYYGKEPIEIRNFENIDERGEKMLIIEILTYPMECWMEV